MHSSFCHIITSFLFVFLGILNSSFHTFITILLIIWVLCLTFILIPQIYLILPLLPLTLPPSWLMPSSKYRPSSEQHNDNFSLSTIAEGSHPNVRKLCDTPPNVPHARALAYYDNIICQVTWFLPLSLSPSLSVSLSHPLLFLHLPKNLLPDSLTLPSNAWAWVYSNTLRWGAMYGAGMGWRVQYKDGYGSFLKRQKEIKNAKIWKELS